MCNPNHRLLRDVRARFFRCSASDARGGGQICESKMRREARVEEYTVCFFFFFFSILRICVYKEKYQDILNYSGRVHDITRICASQRKLLGGINSGGYYGEREREKEEGSTYIHTHIYTYMSCARMYMYVVCVSARARDVCDMCMCI